MYHAESSQFCDDASITAYAYLFFFFGRVFAAKRLLFVRSRVVLWSTGFFYLIQHVHFFIF